MIAPQDDVRKSRMAAMAMRFVLLTGAVSLFSDFTHEGARSLLGPYLALLGASAFIVGLVTGFGEFLGYALRLVSGRWADATGRFWPITILGYVVQMAAVPALALTRLGKRGDKVKVRVKRIVKVAVRSSSSCWNRDGGGLGLAQVLERRVKVVKVVIVASARRARRPSVRTKRVG